MSLKWPVGATSSERMLVSWQELFRKVQPQQCLGSVWSRRTSGGSGRGQQTGGRGAGPAGAGVHGRGHGGQAQGGGDETVASVSATVDQFNAVTHRVIAGVVGDISPTSSSSSSLSAAAGAAASAGSTSQRARVIEKWIDIAQVWMLLCSSHAVWVPKRRCRIGTQILGCHLAL